ncbi:MAG: hydroxylamine oxidase [Deltaproteobacteria bacterium]|nr:hydroxylamine oxidase [Deltaproteobacteria bacterium]
MKVLIMFFSMLFIVPQTAFGADSPLSADSDSCLECHTSLHPGIVAAWQKSRMSKITPKAAKALPAKNRRVSFDQLSEALAGVVVGCAECHMLNPETHKDSFDHNGHQVHTVVTPRDCSTCHPVEAGQFEKNIMSHAYGNLENNPVYQDLTRAVTGLQTFDGMTTSLLDPDELTLSDACRQCHGTSVRVEGSVSKDTPFGDMEFPVLSGWPNQGVGRINPDGSKGSCSACHTRHQFSIEMARKPHTCSQCHKGPDVPAYKVYEVSKHGNLHSSLGHEWAFDAVPWTVGKDLAAPTCATCHVSLLMTEEGDLVGERTHQMNDRLAWRIFGLPYAHPHPRSPDTTIIRNKAGLPLPTELTGEPVMEYLIDEKEQETRRGRMKQVCSSCHSRFWVEGHFRRYENTIAKTNEMTLTATKILLAAWEQGAAKGLGQKDSIFDEAIEKKWVEQWLFYANSTRYSSAMIGADYGVFAEGRWYMSKNIQEMVNRLHFKMKEK